MANQGQNRKGHKAKNMPQDICFREKLLHFRANFRAGISDIIHFTFQCGDTPFDLSKPNGILC